MQQKEDVKTREIDFEKDADGAVADGDLRRIATLAQEQLRLEGVVTKLNEQLKQAGKDLLKISDDLLPSLMDEVGMQEFTLADGQKVSIKENLYASITQKNKSAAAQWLLDNGYGSLVKEDVITSFDKGDAEKARALLENLLAEGYQNCKLQEAINTGSVKAIINERRAEDLPSLLIPPF